MLCLPWHLSIYLSIHLSIYYISLCLHLSIYPSIYLFLSPSADLSTHPYIYLPIYISMHLPAASSYAFNILCLPSFLLL